MTTMNIDWASLSDSQLRSISNASKKEINRRIALKPEENFEKSVKKSYPEYLRYYKEYKNPTWKLFDVCGWSFEKFRDLMVEEYKGITFKSQRVLNYILPIERIIEERHKKWREENNSQLNNFCDKCDRYYIGKCEKH